MSIGQPEKITQAKVIAFFKDRDILDYTYLKGKQDLTRSEEISLAKKISKDFEKLEENDPTIYDNRWDREFTICVIYCMYNGCCDAQIINSFANAAKAEISTRLGQRDISRLDDVWREHFNV